MAWELEFWNPTRTTLLRALRSDTSIEVDEGFTWQLDPNGNCRQWKTKIRNDQLDVPPRAVVVFRVDGKPRFFGVAVDPPSVNSPDSEDLVALGGRELLRVALLDGRVYSGGVFAMVRDILARLCPGALTYSATLIGNGTGTDAGPSLDTFYKPHASLADALDELAKSAQVDWGVDVQGRVFFGRPAAQPLTVPFDSQEWRRLRVQGRETVTRARMPVLTAPANLTPTTNYVNAKSLPYRPKAVTVTAEHAQHNTYRAEAQVALPEGVSLWRRALPASMTGQGFGSFAAATDGDPATSTNSAGAGWSARFWRNRSTAYFIPGFTLTYELTAPDNLGARYMFRVESALNGVNRNMVSAEAQLEPTLGEPVTLTGFLPPDARHGDWQSTTLELTPTNALNAQIHLKIYDVAFFDLDPLLGEGIAGTFLHVPFHAPAEITLGELRDPSPTVTVLGSPQGDVTGPAALFDYAHLPGRPLTTIVKIGAGGQSETAREVQWMVNS